MTTSQLSSFMHLSHFLKILKWNVRYLGEYGTLFMVFIHLTTNLFIIKKTLFFCIPVCHDPPPPFFFVIEFFFLCDDFG